MQVITKLDLGGAETVSVDLVGALRDRFDFALFAIFDLADPTRVGRNMTARLAQWRVPVFHGTAGHFKKGGAFVAAWRLARAIRRFKPDVVHLHTEVPELTFAIATLLSRGARRAAVLRTVHNCELWIDWERIGRLVTGRLCAADAIAVSQAAAGADAAIATRRPRVSATVVPNGVMPPPFFDGATREGPFRLLFAVSFRAAKGHRSAARYPADRPIVIPPGAMSA